MKRLILYCSVCFLFCSCTSKCDEHVIYIKDLNGLKDTTIASVDFNVEKDAWINNVLNNENFVRTLQSRYAFNEIVVTCGAFRIESYYLTGNKVDMSHPFVDFSDSAGKAVLFERWNLSPMHRVSQKTCDRIYNLVFNGK